MLNRKAAAAHAWLGSWVAVGAALLAIGCVAARPEPDLARLYEGRLSARRSPVIVIPGVLGSRLVDPENGREAWPGGVWNLLSGRHFRDLELATADALAPATGDRLAPSGVLFEAFGRDYYETIVDTLEGPGGYRCVPAEGEFRRADIDCVIFSWDWRKDLVDAARHLSDLVQRLREVRGDPALRVDIVAHSAGGLVARYFVRFGAEDVLARANLGAALASESGGAVRRLVLIGTPNYGSVSALQGAIMGTGVGFSSLPPELLATMPSLFELFPNPNRTWMIGPDGKRVDIDLFDVATWREFSWSIFDPTVRARIAARFPDDESAREDLENREAFFAAALERARRFHRVLSMPLTASTTQYLVFGGDCDLTPALCLLETVNGRAVVRLQPREVQNRIPGVDYARLMLAPGDGRVTKAPLLARNSLSEEEQPGFFPITYAVFICRSHAELPSDITFRDNLLNALLY